MCFRLAGRLKDDEESIKKLIVELFSTLWFTPIGSSSSVAFPSSRSRTTPIEGSKIARRVQSILEVVRAILFISVNGKYDGQAKSIRTF